MASSSSLWDSMSSNKDTSSSPWPKNDPFSTYNRQPERNDWNQGPRNLLDSFEKSNANNSVFNDNNRQSSDDSSPIFNQNNFRQSQASKWGSPVDKNESNSWLNSSEKPMTNFNSQPTRQQNFGNYNYNYQNGSHNNYTRHQYNRGYNRGFNQQQLQQQAIDKQKTEIIACQIMTQEGNNKCADCYQPIEVDSAYCVQHFGILICGNDCKDYHYELMRQLQSHGVPITIPDKNSPDIQVQASSASDLSSQNSPNSDKDKSCSPSSDGVVTGDSGCSTEHRTSNKGGLFLTDPKYYQILSCNEPTKWEAHNFEIISKFSGNKVQNSIYLNGKFPSWFYKISSNDPNEFKNLWRKVKYNSRFANLMERYAVDNADQELLQSFKIPNIPLQVSKIKELYTQITEKHHDSSPCYHQKFQILCDKKQTNSEATTAVNSTDSNKKILQEIRIFFRTQPNTIELVLINEQNEMKIIDVTMIETLQFVSYY